MGYNNVKKKSNAVLKPKFRRNGQFIIGVNPGDFVPPSKGDSEILMASSYPEIAGKKVFLDVNGINKQYRHAVLFELVENHGYKAVVASLTVLAGLESDKQLAGRAQTDLEWMTKNSSKWLKGVHA